MATVDSVVPPSASIDRMQPSVLSVSPKSPSGRDSDVAGHKRKLEKDDNGEELTKTASDESVDGINGAGSGGDIPESKRRAQNRAAQRAFRERKEKHLKDLEARLAELESESRSWRLTNMALRSQLSLLEDELQHYRNPQRVAAPAAEIAPPASLALPSHLNTSSLGASTSTSRRSAPAPPRQTPSQQQSAAHAPSNGFAQTSSTTSATSRSVQPPSPSGQRFPVTAPALDPVESLLSFEAQQVQPIQPIVPPQQSLRVPQPSSSPVPTRAEEFCEKLSMACVPADKPSLAGVPRIASEFPEWQPDSLFGQNTSDWLTHNNSIWGSVVDPGAAANANVTSIMTGTSVPDLFNNANSSSSASSSTADSVQSNTPASVLGSDDATQSAGINLDFGNIATEFGGFQFGAPTGPNLHATPDVTNLFGNDYSVFDPLDDLMNWDEPEKSQSQQPQLSQLQQNYMPGQEAPETQQQQQQHFQQQQQQATPHQQQVTQQQQQQQPLSERARLGLVGIGPAASKPGSSAGSTIDDAYTSKDESVPAATQKFIPCSDVWDRICGHPKFGEIDINSMCHELRDKARCSKVGVVLDVQDVDDMLSSF